MMDTPKFIITRFAHGTAGKFLSTVLQTSNLIDHWSPTVQKEKESGNFLDEVTLQYVRRSFPVDHTLHLQNEPMVPYCTDLYSTGYTRGQETTLEQYLNYAQKIKDIRLDACMEKNLLANLIFHKLEIPIFCQGAPVVTVLVNTSEEKNWLHRTLWSKHFAEIDNRIHHLPSDPNYCSFVSLPTVLKFHNDYHYDINEKDRLFNKYILEHSGERWYTNPNNVTKFDNLNNLNNKFINLKDFFELDTFINTMSSLFNYFNLGTLNKSLVSNMYNIWWGRQLKL